MFTGPDGIQCRWALGCNGDEPWQGECVPQLTNIIVMDMVIFRTIFFKLLVSFTFTLLTLHSVY